MHFEARPYAATTKGVAIGIAAFSFPVMTAFAIYTPIIRYASIAMIAVVIFYEWARLARQIKYPHFVFSVASVVTICAAVYLSSANFTAEKPTTFIFVALFFGLGLSVILFDEEVVRSLHVTFIILGFLMLISLLVAPAQYQSERLSLGSNNPIWVARNLGLATLGTFMLWLRSNSISIIPLLIAIASLAAIVVTGSRGPLVAAAVTMSFGVLFGRSSNRWVKITILGVTSVVVLLFVLQSTTLGQTRGLNILNPQDASAESRMAMYTWTLKEIWSNPAGIGIGNFDFFPHVYPHNIFLEFLVEWGWGLGLLAIAAIVIGALTIFRLPASWEFVRLILIYELINASVSGDVNSPRYLYAICFFGLFLALNAAWRKATGGAAPQ